MKISFNKNLIVLLIFIVPICGFLLNILLGFVMWLLGTRLGDTMYLAYWGAWHLLFLLPIVISVVRNNFEIGFFKLALVLIIVWSALQYNLYIPSV